MNISYIQTKSLLNLVRNFSEGKMINLSDGMCGWIKSEELHITKLADYKRLKLKDSKAMEEKKSFLKEFDVPICIEEKEYGFKIYSKFVENKNELVYNTGAWCFPYERVKGAQIRFRREGDWIRPNKGSGRKSLKKYFVDEKIPLSKRDTIPLLARESEIIWVCNVTGSYSDEEFSDEIMARVWCE